MLHSRHFSLIRSFPFSVLWHSWLISSSELNSFLGSYSCSLSSSLRFWPILSDSFMKYQQSLLKCCHRRHTCYCVCLKHSLPKSFLHSGQQKRLYTRCFLCRERFYGAAPHCNGIAGLPSLPALHPDHGGLVR